MFEKVTEVSAGNAKSSVVIEIRRWSEPIMPIGNQGQYSSVNTSISYYDAKTLLHAIENGFNVDFKSLGRHDLSLSGSFLQIQEQGRGRYNNWVGINASEILEGLKQAIKDLENKGND